MGAPIPKMELIDNGTAEALLSSLQGMSVGERRKHASVFNYWLSIRGDRQFPAIRDLDPLEISDAGPWSVLLELIGPGENAVVRHLGQEIKLDLDIEMIARAPASSLLASIHAKLPDIAAAKQALAFEDSFDAGGTMTRCWVTLMPFSTSGTWVDYVYGFVSLDAGKPSDQAEDSVLEPGQVPLGPLDEEAEVAKFDDSAPQGAAEVAPEPDPEPELEPETVGLAPEPESEPEAGPEAEPDELEQPSQPLADFELEPEPEPELEPVAALESDPAPEPVAELEPEPRPEEEFAPLDSAPPTKAGFSARFMESLANVGGFYGRVVHPADSIGEPLAEEPTAEEPVSENPAEEAVFAEPLAEEPIVEHVEDAIDVVELTKIAEVADPVSEPTCEMEGSLQNKLTEVRAMAEEARQAQLRAQLAIIAGLSAAYDFALDAESEPEEYLRLVEGQGLKIQLRSPMKPVVKLAFADSCDEATIAQLEAVLAWALKMDLPRGTLSERIEAEGGIGTVLEGLGKAA